MGKVILGVDPGLSGALAAVSLETGKIISVFDMPIFSKKGSKKTINEINDQELAFLIGCFDVHIAVVEQVSALPGQGVTSMFRLGSAFGTIKGVLAGLGVPFITVHPAKWKKDMRLSGDKAMSRQLASRVWPDTSHEFRRVKDDGRAEAALLAKWLRDQGGKDV
jgi:crossover junction endodeoxyribonuclease RuvC